MYNIEKSRIASPAASLTSDLLEEKVSERTRELVTAKTRIEEKEARKTRFLNVKNWYNKIVPEIYYPKKPPPLGVVTVRLCLKAVPAIVDGF